MTKYRIVSNGLNYRVQWLGKTILLRRPKWYWLLRCNYADSFVATFSSVMDAQNAITECEARDKAMIQGYIPV